VNLQARDQGPSRSPRIPAQSDVSAPPPAGGAVVTARSGFKRVLNDHRAGLEPNLSHPRAGQPQNPGKCRRDAHAVPPCKPLTVEQPAACREGGGRVANHRAPSENSLRPAKSCSNPESGPHCDHIDAGRPPKSRASSAGATTSSSARGGRARRQHRCSRRPPERALLARGSTSEEHAPVRPKRKRAEGDAPAETTTAPAPTARLHLGDCGTRPNWRCCLLTGPSSTGQLASDRLAVSACKHPTVLLRFGHSLVRLPGRSSPHESGGRRANRNRFACPTGSRGDQIRQVAAVLSRSILASV
jgi:hypothetical protein